jgi:ribulose-5-phosphate 4-epimerase/fuculose-1-phosphate aldolase
MSILEQKYEDAVWIARTLYSLGKAKGSSANMSFKHEDQVYITKSGACFGTLTKEHFSIVSMSGNNLTGLIPSKELMLHLHMYSDCENVGAVIHTHSHYATLWSCLNHKDNKSIVPNYTPYLKMKLGRIGLVPYAKPGSQKLFDIFRQIVNETKGKGFLLAHHGPIVAHKDLMTAYFALEELEESCYVAFDLRNIRVSEIES